MRPVSWKQAWEEGRTPWDAGASPPVLVELVASGTLPRGRALVPGAGSGYDVLTLASDDRDVTGLDLSPIALERFEKLREEAGVPAERARMVSADFFDFTPPHRFELIWDYTFLCAIDPARRRDWATRMDELLAREGELVTLIFPVNGGDPSAGPPYPMTPDLVRDLLEPRFVATHLAEVTHSHPRRQGKEWLGRWQRRS